MPFVLTPEQIDAALTRPPLAAGLSKYLAIQRTLHAGVDTG